MTKTELYPRLLDSVDLLRRQWRQQKLLQGCLLTLGVVLLVIGVLTGLDTLFQPGMMGRFLLALLFWSVALTTVVRFVLGPWLEDRRDDFFAALVEERHPELNNQFINALQLGRGHRHGSPLLIDAIVRDAVDATAELEWTGCLSSRALKRAAWFALGAVVVITALIMSLGPRFSNSLARILMPLADIPAYTSYIFEEASMRPGNARVPEGEAVTIEAAVKARLTASLPAVAQLQLQVGEHPAQTIPTSVHSDGLCRFLVPRVTESFEYIISAGDAHSRAYHVEMIPRPKIEHLTVTLAWPEYTQAPLRVIDPADGEIAGIAGTTVTVRLRASKPLREAALLTEEGQAFALQKVEDERSWQVSFLLWGKNVKPPADLSGQLLRAPTRYRIKLVDQEPEACENTDRLWRSISLNQDQPPRVALVLPGRDVQLRPTATLPLVIEARDDFGIVQSRLLYRVNDEKTEHELARFDHAKKSERETRDSFQWNLARSGLKAGDLVQFWATAEDNNTLTGPGQGESRRFTLYVLTPESITAKLEMQIQDYAAALEELLRLQRANRAQTSAGVEFLSLLARQNTIRDKTGQLAQAMQHEAFPLKTVIDALDDLHAGLMAEAVHLFEKGRALHEPAAIAQSRQQVGTVEDRIIKKLQELLERLQRNEQAREALRKLAKSDRPAHQTVTSALTQLIKDIDKLQADKTELADKFEKLPKKTTEKLAEDSLKAAKEFEEFQAKIAKWAKGKIDELAKLPAGFVDDFGLRADANKVFEEVEKTATRPKAEKMEISLEDLGAALGTKMKEDLETWLADTPDAAKWVLEEPIDPKGLKVPEMPLPKSLEDLIGDLLQKAEEFDEEADDVTSAWGDNLDQAGWGVGDGPISSFSAKGKTGNDLPNNNELQGRAGDGRQGKSSGQMVGDTSRGLPGRNTPARVTSERYEPGQLKQEGQQDPKGVTGGGKKAGAGRHGLQGGSPPDFVRDMGRLSEKQAGVREKAEQVAQQLQTLGITSKRLGESIQLMKSAETDWRDLRYQDAARKRHTALGKLKAGLDGLDGSIAVELNRARDLPAPLRRELLQSHDEEYPEGFETLLKNYYKALSTPDKK